MLFGMELAFPGAEWIYLGLVVALCAAVLYVGRTYFKNM